MSKPSASITTTSPVDAMKFDEIARTTSQSINTVASRYRYALEKMRAVLGERR